MKIGNLNITIIVLGAISLAAEVKLHASLDPIPVGPVLSYSTIAGTVVILPLQSPATCPPMSPPASPARKRRAVNPQPSMTK